MAYTASLFASSVIYSLYPCVIAASLPCCSAKLTTVFGDVSKTQRRPREPYMRPVLGNCAFKVPLNCVKVLFVCAVGSEERRGL
jgi:hypothetical protein